MSFCPKCGAQNVEGSPFCTQCGTPIQGVEAPQYGAAPSSGANPFRVGSETQTVGRDITGEAPEVPNPFRAFIICMKKYVDANGRAGRAEYFGFGFVFFILIVLIGIIFGIVLAANHVDPEQSRRLGNLLGRGMYLIVLLPCWCLTIRRLHDLGQSGWISIVNIIPIVNLILGLILLFVPGQPFPNKYGLQPQRRR